ncbi:MAG: circadian clock protein KaiA [Leptolyngbyaceae cyanobacterium]
MQSRQLGQALELTLDGGSYRVHIGEAFESFLTWIWQNRHRIDCLVLELSPLLAELLAALKKRDVLLPVLVVEAGDQPAPASETTVDRQVLAEYHEETMQITLSELSKLEDYIHQAIQHFLHLHNQAPEGLTKPSLEDTRHFLLSLQQQRLTEKLRERLGYMGVFYKRNPDNFIRNLQPEEREAVFTELRKDYRQIVLNYFVQNEALNQKIDDFVNTAFFADVSVSKLVEVHMELMDDFSTQLKLEGRSEEILLDYRLTLIDVIAHLCEMYRRSIPHKGRTD